MNIPKRKLTQTNVIKIVVLSVALMLFFSFKTVNDDDPIYLDPYIDERVIRGGSFLCNASYCASYRVSSRMATDPSTSLEHLGFRTVMDLKTE